MFTLLHSIVKYCAQRPVLRVLGLMGLVAIPTLLLGDSAWAVETTPKETTEQSIASMVALGIQFLNTLLWPFLVLIGELMDNDYIIGPGMEDRLLGIWVQVRNIVNIAFVLVLLVIAFYNVTGIGGGEGNLALKTALPKLVVGLILVNFTFLAGKVVLDLTNVATTAVFGLPEIVEEYDFTTQRDRFAESVCLKPDGATPYNTETDEVPYSTQLFCELPEGQTSYSGNLIPAMEATYFTDLNVNNISLFMAVNMGALEDVGLLKDEAIQDFGDLIVNSLFAIVLYAITAITYIVLALVLLTRIVVMWLALALSPIAVLFYVVPQLRDSLGGGGDIVNKITKNLLAPIIIGLTMTIGYLMISAIWDVGGAFNEFGELNFDNVMGQEFLLSGMEDMEKFIIAIASVIVVWTGVFAAAEGTFAQLATDAVQGAGQSAGKFLAKAPFYLPTIPFPTRNGQRTPVSFSAVNTALGDAKRAFQLGEFFPGNTQQQQVDNITSALGIPGLGRLSNDAQNASRYNPERNISNFAENLSELGGVPTDRRSLQNLSGIVRQIIQQNTGLSAADKTDAIRRIEEASTDSNSFRTVLRDIANDRRYRDLDYFGQGNASGLDRLLGLNSQAQSAPGAAGASTPTAPSTPAPTSAPSTPTTPAPTPTTPATPPTPPATPPPPSGP